MRKVLLYFLFLLSLPALAKDKTDSLKQQLKDNLSDTARVNTLLALGRVRVAASPVEALEYTKQAITLSEKNDFDRGLADAYALRGEIGRMQGSYDQSLSDYFKALEIFERNNDKQKTAELYIQYARLYNNLNNREKQFEYLSNAKQLFTELKQPKNVARIFDETGRAYWGMQQYNKALLAYREAEKMKKQINDEQGLGLTYQWLGNVYFYLNELGKAKEYYLKSKALAKKYDQKSILTYSVQNLGFIFKNEKNYEEAEKLFYESLNMFREQEESSGIIFTYQALGSLYEEQKKFDKARAAWNEGLAYAKKVGARAQVAEFYSFFQTIYSEMDDYKNAFDFQNKYYGIKDSLLNEENSRKMSDQESKYETERKDAVASAEKRKQEIILWSVISGLLLVVLFAVIVFRAYRQKQKANIEISQQKAIIEEKNKNITDSINYAKRIQEAVLTPKELKYKLFPNSFVLYQPRDIVSGDFYWFAEINGKKLIAAVDCTGHGVPGAFMSIIGNNFLNEIVLEKGITAPAEILNNLREMVIASLKQSEGESKDGMDIAILSFDDSNKTVEFAGANNPLWLLRNKTLSEISADKQPIGFYEGEMRNFTGHKIELQQNDSLYIFTDGFADQFGGEKGKKFKYRQFQEILLSTQNLPMLEQEKKLSEKYNQWKGNLEQVDDVLVIGVKI